MEEKIFCILLWYKTYPAFWLLGILLGFDASNACRLIKKRQILVHQAADPELGIYLKRAVKHINKGRKKISSFEDLEREFPEIAETFVDVAKQHRLRPKKHVQKHYYSGKKKRHTLKNELITGSNGRILLISKPYPGKYHDYDMFKRERKANHIPYLAHSHLDRGFQGVKKDFPNHNFLTPIKCNHWKWTLTRSEHIFNTKFLKKRIKIEYLISRLKKYALLGSVFRNRITSYQTDFRNIAAMINFRLVFAT